MRRWPDFVAQSKKYNLAQLGYWSQWAELSGRTMTISYLFQQAFEKILSDEAHRHPTEDRAVVAWRHAHDPRHNHRVLRQLVALLRCKPRFHVYWEGATVAGAGVVSGNYGQGLCCVQPARVRCHEQAIPEIFLQDQFLWKMWLGWYHGNAYLAALPLDGGITSLTTLPLVCVHHHGRVTRWDTISPRASWTSRYSEAPCGSPFQYPELPWQRAHFSWHTQQFSVEFLTVLKLETPWNTLY